MSALTIHPLPRTGLRPGCADRCQTQNGIKDAAASISLIGRPYNGTAGHHNYCTDCIRRITAEWEHLTGTTIVPLRKSKEQRGRERAARLRSQQARDRIAA